MDWTKERYALDLFSRRKKCGNTKASISLQIITPLPIVLSSPPQHPSLLLLTMLDGDDTVDDIAMNSAAADTEATSGKPSILRKSSYEEITNDTKPSSLRKPKFGVHDDSPLKIAMDQFPGSNNNIEEGLVQQQTSTSPPQSSKRASFDDAEGLGSPIPKRDSIEDSRLSSRVSFDDNAPSVKDYVTPKQRDSLDHNRMMKARLSTVSKMYGKLSHYSCVMIYALYVLIPYSTFTLYWIDIDGDGQLDEAELASKLLSLI